MAAIPVPKISLAVTARKSGLPGVKIIDPIKMPYQSDKNNSIGSLFVVRMFNKLMQFNFHLFII